MEVKELGHLVLYVRDLDSSVGFYRDVLGFRPITPTIEGMRAAAFSSGRTHHELLLIEVGPDASPVPRVRHLGLYHFGLWADSPRVAMITGTGGIITVGPPFYRPERLTLQRAGREPETRAITLPGHGFTYEAEEVARCLRAGLTESPVLTLDDTLAVMRTLDAARADFGH